MLYCTSTTHRAIILYLQKKPVRARQKALLVRLLGISSFQCILALPGDLGDSMSQLACCLLPGMKKDSLKLDTLLAIGYVQ